MSSIVGPRVGGAVRVGTFLGRYNVDLGRKEVRVEKVYR